MRLQNAISIVRHLPVIPYGVEIFFDFRDAPYFTGREFNDRLLGAERNLLQTQIQ